MIIFFFCLNHYANSQTWELKSIILNNSSGNRIPHGIAILEDTLGNHITFSNVIDGILTIKSPVKNVYLIINAFGFHTFQKRIDFIESYKKNRTNLSSEGHHFSFKRSNCKTRQQRNL